MKIPFRFMPGSWGLKGDTRRTAQAEYELTGYELEIELANIKFNDAEELQAQTYAIDFKYEKISEYAFETRMANLTMKGEILAAKLLEIDLRHGKITEKEHDYALAELRDDDEVTLKVKSKHGEISQTEYEKGIATIKGEPWVDVTAIDFSGATPASGSLELDWNEYFIEYLHEAGYVSAREEDTVDLWITDLCKNIALDELSGTGVFDDDADQAMEVKRKRLGNGKTEVK